MPMLRRTTHATTRTSPRLAFPSRAAAAIALMLAACAPVAPRTSAPAVPRGTLLRLRMPAPSMGERARAVRIYLPASYAAAADSGQRHPVVFMLHGWPGSEGNLP